MPNPEMIAQLELQVGTRRERAAEARRLAGEVDDMIANHSLLQRAEELDREAEEFEIQLVVLQEEDELVDADTDREPGAANPPSEFERR